MNSSIWPNLRFSVTDNLKIFIDSLMIFQGFFGFVIFEMHTTRIFAVKIQVANFEMHTTRTFCGTIHVKNFEMHTTRIFEVKIPVVTEMHRTKIRVANFEIEQPDFCSENPSCKCTL